MQQTRDAIRNISRGRGDIGDYKRLLMYNATLPAIYTIIKGGLDFWDDEEDQADAITSMMTSFTNGLPIIGSMAKTMFENNLRKEFYDNLDLDVKDKNFDWSASVINAKLAKTVNDMTRVASKENPTDEDKFKAYLASPIEVLTGLPIKNIKKLTYDNYQRIEGDKPYDNWRNFFGWNEYATVGDSEEKKSNKKPVAEIKRGRVNARINRKPRSRR